MTPLRKNFIQRMELKGLSPRTVQNYVQVVARISQFYNSSPLKLSTQQIKDYFHHHIKNKLLAPRSINLHIGALITFYNFMLPESDIMNGSNRHCPQCQAMSRAKWVEKRNKELLPVSYYHIVFTIPEQLKPFALRNKEVFYNILFKAASQTLLHLGANPSFLGGKIGMIAILHTWNQKLMDHPHIHCRSCLSN